jgi:hypothetical protein
MASVIISSGYFDDGEFEDRLVRGEAEGADFLRGVRNESADEIGGVGMVGEFHVTGRGVGVGVRMGVEDTEEFEVGVAELADDGENFGGVDFVGDAGSGGDVFGGVEVSDGGRRARESGEESAGFEIGMRLGEEEDLVEEGGEDGDGIQHGDSLREGRNYLKDFRSSLRYGPGRYLTDWTGHLPDTAAEGV